MKWAAAVLASLVLSCATPKIAEQGFTTTPDADGGVVVRFDAPSGMNEPDIRRNLLHHAARLTLDRGDLYFSIEDIQVWRGTKVQKKDAPKSSEPGPIAEQGSDARPGSTPVYSTSMRVSYPGTGTARVRTFKTRPPGVKVLEASKVIEETSQ